MHEKTPSTSYKRAYDLTILAGAHLFPPLIPVWIALWTVIPILIKLDDGGPVFFRQKRAGKNGKVFTFLKFRTMVVNAEASGLVTSDQDQRVTRVGRILRRTALDELPQLINILKGEMSFVGPRPLPVEMHEEATREEPRFPERLKVTPGLTGLAQIYLPRHCPPKRRLRYDLIYVRNASLWLDMKLMALAVLNTLTGSWGTGHRKPQVVIDAETAASREVS